VNHSTATVPYPLSLHGALPISDPHRPVAACPAATLTGPQHRRHVTCASQRSRIHSDRMTYGQAEGLLVRDGRQSVVRARTAHVRSEEHTSELQSREKLVCRLLL